MKNVLKIIILTIFITTFCTSLIAGESELIIEKLVEKEIITPVEGQILLDEANKAKAEEDALAQKVKIKGDLRSRFQSEKKANDNYTRNRMRVRARLGIEGSINDKFSAFLGLCTGGTDPRSTNQTFDNGFSTKGINLDYAYFSWEINSNISLYGGKIVRKKVLWQPSDLLWDGDINTEGFALLLNQSINENLDVFFNTSYFVLDEIKTDNADIDMVVFQPGIQFQLSEAMSLKTAIGIYNFNNFKGKADQANMTGSSGTNTNAVGIYSYDYNISNLSFQLDWKKPIGFFDYAALFGDYIQNPDSDIALDESKTGYLIGIKFGDSKIGKTGTWQAKVMTRSLGKDAWVDFLSDSDFYGGATGYQGTEFVFSYALAKNAVLGFDYYSTNGIKNQGVDNAQNLYQLDLKLKF